MSLHPQKCKKKNPITNLHLKIKENKKDSIRFFKWQVKIRASRSVSTRQCCCSLEGLYGKDKTLWRSTQADKFCTHCFDRTSLIGSSENKTLPSVSVQERVHSCLWQCCYHRLPGAKWCPEERDFWGMLMIDTWLRKEIGKNLKRDQLYKYKSKVIAVLIYVFHFLLTAMPSDESPESTMNNSQTPHRFIWRS